MIRFFAVALALACLAAPLRAQAPSEQVPYDAAKPVAKRPAAPRSRPAPMPAFPDNGPCRLGVIPAIGDVFAVDKFGLTIFGNEHDEVSTNWGLDDLIFARVRAAAGPDLAVRRIMYRPGAFDPYYHPASRFLPDPREGLPAIVRGIAGDAGCERYLVITKFAGQLPGTNLKLDGIGAYNRGLGNIIRHSALYANIALTLLDGQTFARQQRFGADFGERLQEKLRLTENPLTRLENESFPEPAASAAGSLVLRDRTRALVANLMDRMLPGYLRE